MSDEPSPGRSVRRCSVTASVCLSVCLSVSHARADSHLGYSTIPGHSDFIIYNFHSSLLFSSLLFSSLLFSSLLFSSLLFSLLFSSLFCSKIFCACSVLLSSVLSVHISPSKPSGHYSYVPPGITLNNSTFYPQTIFMCFVWI